MTEEILFLRLREPRSGRRPVSGPTHPEEVAAACEFLTGDAGSGITGEDMNVSAVLVM